MTSTPTITYTGELRVVTCWCGIVHAIPADLDRWVDKSEHNSVHCPLGHTWVRKTSKVQRLQDEVARLRAGLDQEIARADHEAARAAGYKGALTKTKKRLAGGVCPCCNRSFVNLARHMAGQHPDYSDAEAVAR